MKQGATAATAAATALWFGYAARDMYTQHQAQSLLETKYADYLSTYSKSYATQEEHQFRLALFIDKEAKIQEWNTRPDATHVIGHNMFSDWSDHETARLRGFKMDHAKVAQMETKVFDVEGAPAAVDWRTKNAVTPVQNQGTCGSCWAFSAIAALEGEHAIKSGKLLKLSEQQCLDCSQEGSCGGGFQSDCFDEGESENINTIEQYPYSGWKSGCWAKSDGPVEVSSYSQLTKKSEGQLKAAIAKQPVSVTVDAGSYPFMHYIEGVITDTTCGSALDHAVTAVGYGSEDGQDYYLIKNSWGADWGESGYVRIGMNGDGQGICGVQQLSLVPTTN